MHASTPHPLSAPQEAGRVPGGLALRPRQRPGLLAQRGVRGHRGARPAGGGVAGGEGGRGGEDDGGGGALRVGVGGEGRGGGRLGWVCNNKGQLRSDIDNARPSLAFNVYAIRSFPLYQSLHTYTPHAHLPCLIPSTPQPPHPAPQPHPNPKRSPPAWPGTRAATPCSSPERAAASGFGRARCRPTGGCPAPGGPPMRCCGTRTLRRLGVRVGVGLCGDWGGRGGNLPMLFSGESCRRTES